MSLERMAPHPLRQMRSIASTFDCKVRILGTGPEVFSNQRAPHHVSVCSPICRSLLAGVSVSHRLQAGSYIPTKPKRARPNANESQISGDICIARPVGVQKKRRFFGAALRVRWRCRISRNLELHADLEGSGIAQSGFVGFHDFSPAAGAAVVTLGDG
jgi:hypothetical protein